MAKVWKWDLSGWSNLIKIAMTEILCCESLSKGTWPLIMISPVITWPVVHTRNETWARLRNVPDSFKEVRLQNWGSFLTNYSQWIHLTFRQPLCSCQMLSCWEGRYMFALFSSSCQFYSLQCMSGNINQHQCWNLYVYLTVLTNVHCSCFRVRFH